MSLLRIRELEAQLARRDARIAELAKDATRLDFVLSNAAFLCETADDAGGKAYQVWAQNEDEDYIVLSGIGAWFTSTRDAIDAAMKESAT